MSLLFTCVCNQPERLLSAIEPVREVLQTRDITRWGLSYVQAGEVLLSRHPKPVKGTFDFFEVLGSLCSDYVIGVATDDETYRGNANTQPFRYKHWVLGMQGDIEDFSEAHDALEAHLPGFLGRGIKGKSPAEYVLYIFLSLLHDSGQIDDHNLPTKDCALALRAALALVQKVCSDTGLSGTLGNVMVSNSRSTLAARLAGPLFLRRLKHVEDPKRPETEFRSVLVVGAESALGEGFEELPAQSILCINRDLSTDIIPL
ncbi:MAG: hypothetical protein GY811_20240 [Myxococcales bacterium]|nr:hypothetical protein [Myxococcales bacterium]